MDIESEDNWLPLFFPIKTGKCEICGELHVVEKCPLIEGFTDHIRDSPCLSYARLTLPEGFEVQELSDGTKTVIATKSFSKGLKFGPFVAKTSTLIDVRIDFPIKVFLSEDESVYLETYEEIFCNWMCLVLPASCVEEQNLICFQIKTSIYFCSLRDIKKGEELRVWYAPYYAEKMGARTFPRPTDLIHSSDEEFQEIFESLQSGVEMQDHPYVPKLKKKRRPPKKLVLGENYYREVPPSDVLPGELLGATSRRRRSEWECSSCGQVERNVAAYARHLMTHYRPPVRPSFRCPYCNRNFRKDGNNRQVHLGVCKRKTMNKLSQGETNESDISRMTFDVRTVNSDAGETSEFVQENKNNFELPLDSSAWDKSVLCNKVNESSCSKNNQVISQSLGITNKKDLLHPEVLNNCKVDLLSNDTILKTNSTTSEWSIGQKNTLNTTVTESEELVNSNNNCKNYKNDKVFGQLRNREENLDDNILVKPDLNTPILDLSDDIDFHLTKSLDEMINDDCSIVKSFSKSRSLDLFGGVETNLLTSTVPNSHDSPLETSSFYSIEKNGFLQQSDFVSCNDVTDEERNRIVENLLSETDDKFFASDYEMTDGCVSENNESQTKDDQLSKNKETGKDEERKSKSHGDFKCEICSKCFAKPIYLYRHLRKHTGEFRCNTCFMIFARKENLQSHRLSCPNEANVQQTVTRVRMFCKFCRLQFHSLSALQEHMEEHYCTGNSWQCSCKETSDSPDIFITHKCRFVKASKSCTKCGKKLSSLEDFVEHKNHPILNVRRKANRSQLCEICGVFNSTITGARLHRSSVHGNKDLECSVCGKCFARKDKLIEHSHVHQNELWECPVCSKTFGSEKLCKKHQKHSHAIPFLKCNFCDKKFRQKCNLTKHVTNIHSTYFKCKFCDEKFTTDSLLSTHLKKKHVGQFYTCDKCREMFTTRWRLKTHIRKIHCEMYKCVYCNEEMKFRSSLRRHLGAFHKDKTEEWDNTEALVSMQLPSAKEAELETEKAVDLPTANGNPSFNDILQTAADDVIQDGDGSLDDNTEEAMDTQTSLHQLSNTNFVTTILQGGMVESSAPQKISFDLNVLHGSEGVPQLVSVDGEILTMPLTYINDMPSPSSTPPVDESTIAISQGAMLNCPLVLPEGCLLTLDNSLIAKQSSEESSTLINISDFQALSGATTSSFVLTQETDAESNLQLQNNVLYYIVDNSITDETE